MNTTTKAGLKVKAGIKAGGLYPWNHNRRLASKTGLKGKAGIKAGGLFPWNHNRHMM
jgi:hypothetical protein